MGIRFHWQLTCPRCLRHHIILDDTKTTALELLRGDFFIFLLDWCNRKLIIFFANSLDLMKNVELELTAKFWCSQASQPIPKTIEEPMLKIPLGQIPPPLVGQVPARNFSIIEEPINKVIIEKKAHRRLIIRKRKMKIHRRKRRWKRNWVMYRKGYLDREKKRETAFRQRMIAKVNEANTFDAKKYVEDYLEDAKYELVPKTYEGKRLPQWLIKVRKEPYPDLKINLFFFFFYFILATFRRR